MQRELLCPNDQNKPNLSGLLFLRGQKFTKCKSFAQECILTSFFSLIKLISYLSYINQLISLRTNKSERFEYILFE